MAVNFTIPAEHEIYPVKGVEIGIAEAGVKKTNHKDLTIFKFSDGTSVAGVFTSNRFRAAPVQISEQHLQASTIRALIINTGNANAGTGEDGINRCLQVCHALSEQLNISEQAVLPFSTGVIMETLPADRIIQAIPRAIADLSENNWFPAAYSIMTTDTLPKVASRKVQIDCDTITITGISKGAGMIRPNMATMLCFMATDIGINQRLLTSMIQEIANRSFNRITVDGDTSTNDSFVIAATGKHPLFIDSKDHPYYQDVLKALTEVALELSQKIVRDAEGATKFVTVKIDKAQSNEEALKVAYSIAHSPLIKTALFASDPNLGRILCAIGYAGIPDLDTRKVKLFLGDVLVSEHGGIAASYTEAQGQAVMNESEILIHVELNRGSCSETVYTCDFSHEYVTINADYRS
ncbi:bifunctional glutamate N-acetyltransferase/amino-acid acetyltransferase ArgJ [Basilea psittacipulmonis]|uniref:Arginine biosynthesis bifunctional protein ArgJ n=1 Tax=Basilea psittacipulmonis DSM 24701 TaxID=1072685 RepID=A0A077DCD9_9BURK|nr:bifunctional glutamate N-acetyltransferase/amino-acid acetyltransferase ArgJ [Basilea psittacipulmonis]AIL32274.1 ornithine acetyltransferase [Basilea psittacipulmonis DSM 24701]